MSSSQPVIISVPRANANVDPYSYVPTNTNYNSLYAVTAQIANLTVKNSITLGGSVVEPWATVIADLDDVTAGPTNGQVHTWNAGSSQWVPTTLAAGGGGDTVYLRTQSYAGAPATTRYFTSSLTPVYGGDGATIFTFDNTWNSADNIVINSAGVYRLDFGFETTAPDAGDVWLRVSAFKVSDDSLITYEETNQLNNYAGIAGERFSASYIVNADSSYFPDGVRIVPQMRSDSAIGGSILAASEANYLAVVKLI